jgi:hypothetical protein
MEVSMRIFSVHLGTPAFPDYMCLATSIGPKSTLEVNARSTGVTFLLTKHSSASA